MEVMNNKLNTHILIVDDQQSIHDDFKEILINQRSNTNKRLSNLEDFLFEDQQSNLIGHDDELLNTTYEIDDAFQGEDAIEMVKKCEKNGNPYSVIIMDVRMPPGINGIEAIAKIWEINPYIEVVISTAYSDYSWDEIIRRVGTTDRLLFLKKPFHAIEVQQMILSLMIKWNFRKQNRHLIDDLEEIVQMRTRQIEKISGIDLSDEAKTSYLSQINYELASPAQNIVGLSQLLQKNNALSEDQLSCVKMIEENAGQLLSLAGDAEAEVLFNDDDTSLSSSTFSISDFVKDISSIMANRAENRGLSFSSEIGASVPELVTTDKQKLRQALVNLLNSAIQYAEEGYVELHVSENRGEVRFDVIDTGVTLNVDEISDIFDTYDDESDSTGSSLALVDTLVTRLGGTLKIDDTREKGNCIYFELENIGAADDDKPAAEKIITGYNTDDGSKIKILIIDDNGYNAGMLMGMFYQLGFDSSTVLDSELGLDKAKTEKPEVILVDAAMGDEDGNELFKAVCDDPDLKDCAVFVTLPKSFTNDDPESFEKAGCLGYIEKPVNLQNMLKVIGGKLGINWTYKD